MYDASRPHREGNIVASTVITLMAAILAAVLLLFLLSDNVIESLRYFFISPFSTKYFFGNMLASSVPLMLAGLGISVAFTSRNFNLGGEGQIYAGAFTAVLLCLALPEGSPVVVQAIALLAGAAAGASIGAMSGILKRALGVNELISSFLAQAAIIYGIDYLITGPFQDPNSNFQTTLAIAPALRFPRLLPPSSLSTGLFLAIAFALAGAFIVSRTRFGYELRVYGQGGEFAQYCGIRTKVYTVVPMSISGALHGLAGAAMIMGSYYKAMKGFSAGTGWSAISVALIAHNNPLMIIPSAFFFAWMDAGAKGLMLGSNVSSEIILIVQAVILFLITVRLKIFPAPKLFSKGIQGNQRQSCAHEGRPTECAERAQHEHDPHVTRGTTERGL